MFVLPTTLTAKFHCTVDPLREQQGEFFQWDCFEIRHFTSIWTGRHLTVNTDEILPNFVDFNGF